MPTDVIMPQMGESIVEGTITKWLKKPGDKVQRDEPLFEISTDKVDAEIPAPTSGVLREIKAAEGATVQVNTVVGVIAGEGETTVASPTAKVAAAVEAIPQAPAAGPFIPAPREAAGAPEPRASEATARPREVTESSRLRDDENLRSSPLVRRIARDNNVDLSQVPGTGLGGRITKQDIVAFLDKHGAAEVRPAMATPTASSMPAPVAIPQEVVPMSQMRKIIAQRMVESRHTSAHVHSLFEVDMTRIVNLRKRLKDAFEQRHGTHLTFMPFLVRSAIVALQQFPIVNCSVEGDNIHYHSHINVGIAVALDWGLIVPVLRNAEEKNFLGLQRGITELGERARNKKLTPDDVQGSTFTITNPGSFGAVFGLPIINQPNVAILGVGGIAKAPVVVTDAQGSDSIAIRSLVHLTLGYDHRVIDGAVADQFLALVKKILENWSEEMG